MLSSIRKNFGFKDSLANLLSNFQITDKQEFSGKGVNLLQLARKKIYFANNEKMLASKTKNLFALLRIIQALCKEVDACLDTDAIASIITHMDTLIAKIREHCDLDFQLRAELYVRHLIISSGSHLFKF